MYHHHRDVFISAPPKQVFAFVDDHSRFSSHMSESSWMMGGGRMTVEVDSGKGQAVGSHIRLTGRVFGVRLFVDEVVMQHDPPTYKSWQTVGTPQLLVIGAYTMGIEITVENGGSRLRVFIDYELPDGWATRWFGRIFGRLYAKWCVDQMLTGTAKNFTSEHSAAA